MKTILIMTYSVMLSLTASAKHWHIHPQKAKLITFHSIAQAMASSEVADGDTLFIHAGQYAYAAFSVSKRLVFIGIKKCVEPSICEYPTLRNMVLNGGSHGSKFFNLAIQQVSYNIAQQSIVFEGCSKQGSFSIDYPMYMPKRNGEKILDGIDSMACVYSAMNEAAK